MSDLRGTRCASPIGSSNTAIPQLYVGRARHSVHPGPICFARPIFHPLPLATSWRLRMLHPRHAPHSLARVVNRALVMDWGCVFRRPVICCVTQTLICEPRRRRHNLHWSHSFFPRIDIPCKFGAATEALSPLATCPAIAHQRYIRLSVAAAAAAVLRPRCTRTLFRVAALVGSPGSAAGHKCTNHNR